MLTGREGASRSSVARGGETAAGRNRNFDPMPGTVHFAFAPASLIVGALTVAFEKAGFREAGRAGMRRHVMRLHLGG
jgi:hypothetical protein